MTVAFSKLLSVSTALIFVLALSNLGMLASENGATFGTDLLYQIPEPTVLVLTPKKTERPAVRGYGVQTATSNLSQNTDTLAPLQEPAITPTHRGDSTFELTDGNSVQIKNGIIIIPLYSRTGGFMEITYKVYDSSSSYLGTTQSPQRIGASFKMTHAFGAHSFTTLVNTVGTNQDVWFSNITFKSLTVATGPVCGNKIKEEGEECDDGNTDNKTDGCLSSCQLCAAPGLPANVYGGAKQQCCSGLILQGGLCNVGTATTPTSTPPAIMPSPVMCSDSDDGKNGKEQGTTKGPDNDGEVKTFKDTCLDEGAASTGQTASRSVVEYFCENDHISRAEINCETGSYCREGKCVLADSDIKPLPKPTPAPDSRDKLIAELKARIERLQLRVSELERKVVERERERETTTDTALVNRLKGKLLIQPQENGEVWYLDPATNKKFYLKDGQTAYDAMRAFGTGMSEKDFGNLRRLCAYVKGKIMLRVENKGEAYYVNDRCEPHYLKNGDAAYQIMREQALGVSNTDIAKIETGDLEAETTP